MSIVERSTGFLQSVLVESRKVTWPSRDELKESTMVVLVATSIVMLYLFLVDRALIFVLNPILG